MGWINDYQKRLEENEASTKAGPGSEKIRGGESLYRATGRLREVPSKIGLFVAGFRLTLLISLFILGLFVLLRIFALPEYDYVVEKRLGDNYRTKFSEYGARSGGPKARDRFPWPPIVGMTQDDERIYLATRGHGVQVLDKDNTLWKTYDETNTDGRLPNEIKEVHFQKVRRENRLWSLGFAGSIQKGAVRGSHVDFRPLLTPNGWRYFTKEEITASLMIDDDRFVVGTASDGAGIYHTRSHRWRDLPETRNSGDAGRPVMKIVHRQGLLWLLTKSGVFVYRIDGGHPDNPTYAFLKSHALDETNGLAEPNLVDMKVFDKDHALAFTGDKGCYLFRKTWSEKLLGGPPVPNLSQETIRYAVHWRHRIVVIGEDIGVAAYDPDRRNWDLLIKSPLPPLNGFDHNEHAIVIATDDGARVIRKAIPERKWRSDHRLAGYRLSKVSLLGKGFLYLVENAGEQGAERVGWSDLDGDRTVLVDNSASDIGAQPEITDVVAHDGMFWIGTRTNGVILYSPDTRSIRRRDAAAGGKLTHINQLGVYKDNVILLSKNRLHQWDAENKLWSLLQEKVRSFRLGADPSDLWIHNLDESLTHRRPSGEEEAWFAGKGPKKLKPASAWAVFEQSGEGRGPVIHFPRINERKMYAYHLEKGSWAPPRELPGKHKIQQIALLNDDLFTLDPKGRVHHNENLLFGDGSPGGSLNSVLLVKQDGGENATISIFGKKRKNDYEPALGKWTRYAYPFLNAKESIVSLTPAAPSWGGRLARTSGKRLLWIDDAWENAKRVKGGARGEHFDGSSFWRLSGGKLAGRMLSPQGDAITIEKRAEYFAGAAPDLSRVLVAWWSDPKLYLATPSHLSVYDARTHSWKNKTLPMAPIEKAKYVSGRLHVIKAGRAWDLSPSDLKGKSIPLPSGTLKKMDVEGERKVATVDKDDGRKVFYRSRDRWNPLTCDRTRFEGDLNAATRGVETADGSWLHDPASGVFGRYFQGGWTNFRLPDFVFGSFWKGPEQRLFLLGKRKGSDAVDVPLYYFTDKKFKRIDPAPARIRDARVEFEDGVGRYLWVRADNGDLFLYDLLDPSWEGLNLTKICFRAISGIRTRFYFDLGSLTAAREMVNEPDRAFRAKLAVEAPGSIHVQRASKDEDVSTIFLRTGRGIYCFEDQDGYWSLTATFRVSGSTSLEEALEKITWCTRLTDPTEAFKKRARVVIAAAAPGANPIRDFLDNRLETMRFDDPSLKPIPAPASPPRYKAGSIRVDVAGQPARFHAIPTGGAPVELPHVEGRFETDRPFIDAAADAEGRWWALREKSLTCYADRSLLEIVAFGLFDQSVTPDAFLTFDNERLLLVDKNKLFSLKIIKGKATPSPVQQEEIHSDPSTGLRVVKGSDVPEIFVHGKKFTGAGRFDFDKIRKIAASDSRLYAMTSRSVWQFVTSDGSLAGAEQLPFPNNFPGKKTFTTCDDGRVLLERGNRLHEISTTFDEVKEKECFGPSVVAGENGWQWHFVKKKKAIFFKAFIDGEWKKTTRQLRDGRFKDDVFTWIVAFDGEIHAASHLGVSRLSPNGEKEAGVIGKEIKELKSDESALYGLARNSAVYKLAGSKQWKKTKEKTAKDFFKKRTGIYSDPLMEIRRLGKTIEMKTRDGKIVSWDASSRKFKTDLIRDFAVHDRGKHALFTINKQNKGIASYDDQGLRSGYYLTDRRIKRFEAGEKTLAAVGNEKFHALKSESGAISWEETGEPIELAARAGLRFRKNPLAEEGAIQPVIGDAPLKEFWQSGRFSFDLVRDMEGGSSSWWTSTPSGLIRLSPPKKGGFETIFPDKTDISRMKRQKGRVLFQIKESDGNVDHLYADEPPGAFSAATPPFFTKTVFDFDPDAASGVYRWSASEIDDGKDRAVFHMKAKTPDDVFHEERFFWDQIVSAAYDPDVNRYWIVTPRLLTNNKVEEAPNRPITLSPAEFSDDDYKQAGCELKDAEVENGFLFALFIPSKNADGAGERVRKRIAGQWHDAPDHEYPFWRPRVEFTVRDYIWRQKKARFSELASMDNNFTFSGPEDYPLFIPYAWNRKYGRFSFDRILSLHPEGDVLWAGSDGGFLKMRHDPAGKGRRLELEAVLLQKDGLHASGMNTSFYSVPRLKKRAAGEALQLLERDERGNEFVQEYTFQSWTKEEIVKFPREKTELIFPGKGDVRYLFEYDPIENRGVGTLRAGKNPAIEMVTFIPLDALETRLEKTADGGRLFHHRGEAIRFEAPETETAPVFSTLSRKPARKDAIVFSSLLSDPAGLEWGELNNGRPAVRLPGGEVCVITGLPDISGLRVGERTLSWAMAGGDENEDVFYYDIRTETAARAEESKERIEWIEYKTKPGDSISLYLLERGIVEKQNFFKKLFGVGQPELKRWVDKIAKKNNIPWGGRDEYDYQLSTNTFYKMPVKAKTVDRAILPGDEPLLVGEKGFDEFEPHDRENTGLLETPSGLFGFAENLFFELDLARNRVFFNAMPTRTPARRLWRGKGDKAHLGFAGDAGGREVWSYTPNRLYDSEISPAEFKRIYVRRSNRIIEAASDGGFTIDNGISKRHITRSSEPFFGVELGDIVEILEDNQGNGFWIAAEYGGLIWSKDPF